MLMQFTDAPAVHRAYHSAQGTAIQERRALDPETDTVGQGFAGRVFTVIVKWMVQDIYGYVPVPQFLKVFL